MHGGTGAEKLPPSPTPGVGGQGRLLNLGLCLEPQRSGVASLIAHRGPTKTAGSIPCLHGGVIGGEGKRIPVFGHKNSLSTYGRGRHTHESPEPNSSRTTLDISSESHMF